jgi:hypothetical protein
MANVIAASWNAGIRPVATVMTASSDHMRMAVNPIRVAVRGVIERSLREKRRVRDQLNERAGEKQSS